MDQQGLYESQMHPILRFITHRHPSRSH